MKGSVLALCWKNKNDQPASRSWVDQKNLSLSPRPSRLGAGFYQPTLARLAGLIQTNQLSNNVTSSYLGTCEYRRAAIRARGQRSSSLQVSTLGCPPPPGRTPGPPGLVRRGRHASVGGRRQYRGGGRREGRRSGGAGLAGWSRGKGRATVGGGTSGWLEGGVMG